jgi:1,4-dihydroxy-2-naphthoate octaprenyltransferase
LIASVAPVSVGCALAYHQGGFRLGPAAAALVGALAIQIGTNLANDVADYVSGADTEARVGPTRAVQAGLLSPRAVALGAAAAFGLAVLAGIYLVKVAGLPILILGVTAIAAGVLYTSGPFPLAHKGLGDVFVLAFFGVAAVAGTTYVQTGRWDAAAVVLGLAVGALADVLLAVNNLRDVETDRLAGKRTLAVRLGDGFTRRWIVLLVIAAFGLPVLLVAAGSLPREALLVLAAVPEVRPVLRDVTRGASGAQLNPVLGAAARLQLWHALFLSLGLAWAPR